MNRLIIFTVLFAMLAIGIGSPDEARGQSPVPTSGSQSRIIARLQRRVADNPNDASAWRLLGRVFKKAGRVDDALAAFEKSVSLDPNSAAAHYDLGSLLVELDRKAAARNHLERSVSLAPGSEYAGLAQSLLGEVHADFQPPGDVATGDITLADFEINRFDGSRFPPEPQTLEEAIEAPRPYRIRVETGALYNGNVTMTPLNRELFPGRKDSAQFFVAPELEWRAIDTPEWGAGPLFLGHFTWNQSEFQNLNLQSYQPGLFLERVFSQHDDLVIVPRLQFGLTHDEFAGRTFGNRHSLMASTAAVRPSDGMLLFGYVSVDHTNFLNDGLFPSITSRDGWTYSMGFAHRRETDWDWLEAVRVGFDLQRADLDGSDYAYNGVSTFTDAKIVLTSTLKLTVEFGWGYRDYYNFPLSPSRNEHIWRGGARLTKQLTKSWSVSGVFNYDRFDSANPLFEASRPLAGIVSEFEY